MRKLMLMLLFVPSLFAQQLVYPRPDASRFTVQKDVAYRGALKFDLYRPAGNAVVPVVITCNVGNPGMKNWPAYATWGELTAANGLAAVHYDATRETATEEFAALVATLRERANEYRLDLSRIVLWGGSSNVRLALPVAMDAKRNDIKGAVIFYGDAELPEFRTDVPVYFVRAGLDTTELNGRIDKMIGRALAANAPWTIDSYGGGLHGFDIFNDNELSREIVDRALTFMKRVVTPSLSAAYVSTADDASLGAAFSRGDWARAIDGYRKRVAANAKDGESHRRLAVALYESGRPSEALEAFELAWANGRRGPRDTGLPAARAAAKAGNRERTLHWLRTILATPWVKKEDVRNDPVFAAYVAELE